MATSDIIIISDSESDDEVKHDTITEVSKTPIVVKSKRERSTIKECIYDSFSPSTMPVNEYGDDKGNVNHGANGSKELSNEKPTVTLNGKNPLSEETFYIDPELKKNFQFEYSRRTNRPGPKSRTRKTLSAQEMYFQIFHSGLNPSNGLKIVHTKQDAS